MTNAADHGRLLDGYRWGRGALAYAALFWAVGAIAWWTVGSAPVHRLLGLSAQFWLAYSGAWLLLAAQARRPGPLRWMPLVALATGAALAGAALGLPLQPDFVPQRLTSPGWLAQRLAPALGFALTLHLLPLAARWREWQRHRREAQRMQQAATVADLSRQVTLAELKTLQAQVEPHFLYNTLAGIQYLVRHNPTLADQMLGRLHDYLRLALPAMREPMSTLGREFALIEAYLALMKMRLGARLTVRIELPDALADAPFPPLMLGNLVENAIQHGIEPLARGGAIEVEARAGDAGIAIAVRDSGVGLQAAAASGRGSGLGLANLRERLRLIYGDAARLEIASNRPAGVAATIVVPAAIVETVEVADA